MIFFSPYFISVLFVFMVGACIGSFLNLVIHRLPLHLSIIYPRSQCPSCHKNIPTFGLIPILSFFLLARKCFYCKSKISWQYPLIEFFCALTTSILYVKFFNETQFMNLLFVRPFHFVSLLPFLTSLWLFYSGVVLSLIDFKYRILPDVITLPGIFIGFTLSALNPYIGFIQSFTGILIGFGGLFLVTKLYEIIRKREGMGFGDVKYLGFIGAVVGPTGVFYTLLLACILGSVVGIIYGIATKKGLAASIPFGPFLAISALCVYVLR